MSKNEERNIIDYINLYLGNNNSRDELEVRFCTNRNNPEARWTRRTPHRNPYPQVPARDRRNTELARRTNSYVPTLKEPRLLRK